MNITDLLGNLSKNLTEYAVPNFQPLWTNNVTRLNQQNLNTNMYNSIRDFVDRSSDTAYKANNDNVTNLIKLLPGVKVADSSSSELHNLDSNAETKNKANGNFQAVFGKYSVAHPQVEGQFIIGQYNTVADDFIFAIGNGTDDNHRHNALEVSPTGELKTSRISITDSLQTPYIKLTESIDDDSEDSYAATKKYVYDKVESEKIRAKAIEDTLTVELNEEISRAKDAEDSIRSLASSAFHFKGSEESFEELPKTGNTIGDVWQVQDKEYAWNGSEWVELGFNIDLSGKQDKFADVSVMIQTTIVPSTDKTYGTQLRFNDVLEEDTYHNVSFVRICESSGKHLTLKGIADGADLYDAVNVQQLNKKQDNLTYDSNITVGHITVGNNKLYVAYDGIYTANGISQIHMSDGITINVSDPTKKLNIGEQGLLNVRLYGLDTPIAEDEAVCKNYVDTNFQTTLVSGTNIKTINNQSLLGSGNIDISGGGSVTVDAQLSTTSTNPVQNKIITDAVNNKQDKFADVSEDKHVMTCPETFSVDCPGTLTVTGSTRLNLISGGTSPVSINDVTVSKVPADRQVLGDTTNYSSTKVYNNKLNIVCSNDFILDTVGAINITGGGISFTDPSSTKIIDYNTEDSALLLNTDLRIGDSSSTRVLTLNGFPIYASKTLWESSSGWGETPNTAGSGVVDDPLEIDELLKYNVYLIDDVICYRSGNEIKGTSTSLFQTVGQSEHPMPSVKCLYFTIIAGTNKLAWSNPSWEVEQAASPTPTAGVFTWVTNNTFTMYYIDKIHKIIGLV